MAGLAKFLGGVVSGGLVAGVTLVVASQFSAPGPGIRADEPAATVTGGITNAAEETTLPAAAPVAVADQPADQVAPSGVEAAPLGQADAVPDAPAAEPPVAPVADAIPASPAVPDVADTALAPTPVAETAAVAAAQVVAPDPAAAVSDHQPATPNTDLPLQQAPAISDALPETTSERIASFTANQPVVPSAPSADGVPTPADLPPPPPLTPVEEAVLADPARIVLPTAPVVPGESVATDDGAADADKAANAADAPTAPVTSPTEPPLVESPVIAAPLVEAPVVAAPEPPPVPAADPAPAVAEPTIVAVDAAPATLPPDQGIVENGPSTLPATPRLITAGDGTLGDAALGDATPDLAETAPAPNADGGVLPEIALTDGPALERFATGFANVDGKPLFGILLFDSGDATLDRQSVAALPFPVSIVVDPLAPEAAAHAALYRAGGKEVVMLASGIPEGATPADLEQTFEAHAAALPEAVAVIDSSDAAFQNDRALSTQIVPILADQGRGLLTWDRGLNAADQVARRQGLATSMVFRQIDAEGEDVPVMRRYLDRAAFKAAQEGKVIVVGQLRPETIAAILEWTIEGRASTVALAPASALLLAE